MNSFLDLPYDTRVMIIDVMEPADRCRFTRCSKICNQEAKASKNYIHELEITCVVNLVRIYVLHGKYQSSTCRKSGFILEFNEETENNTMRYFNLDKTELWNIKLDKSFDYIRCGIDTFKKLLQNYQKTIKSLEICEFFIIRGLRNYNFEVSNLRNLEMLKVCGDLDPLPFLSKSRRPLKELEVYVMQKYEGLADCKEIYNCHNTLTIANTSLNSAQMSKLTAKNVTMLIDKLTAEDILDFIDSWKNGTIRKVIDTYRWCIETTYTKSILPQISHLLNVNLMFEKFEVKHDKDAAKRAELGYISGYLQFKTFSS